MLFEALNAQIELSECVADLLNAVFAPVVINQWPED